MLTLFERALLIHLIADWLLQNDWMARNKENLRHPASWVHSGIHAVLLGLVLGWQWGALLGMLHIIIDTRAPLRWWQRVFRQTTGGGIGTLVGAMGDQALHIMSIGIVVEVIGFLGAKK